MVCAIYGIMLFANQQFALAIEDGMSWIFAFPILIYAAQNPSSVAAVCAAAMALETFLFGGFTTWFYSWTSIVIGYLYGIGIYRRWSSDIKLVVTFLYPWDPIFLYSGCGQASSDLTMRLIFR